MIESSQSHEFDVWLETQEALNKLRSTKASIHGQPENDPCPSIGPEPYRKRRWSRSSSRGEDLCQHQYQRKQQSQNHHRHSYSNSSSNSLNSYISHLAVTSIDNSKNEKITAPPVEVIDLTFDDEENGDSQPQNNSVPAVKIHNDDRMEPDSRLPKMETKVCEPQTDKYEDETDYDADSDMEIDCDDAKDEDYREDSAFKDEEEDHDDDDYNDYNDSDEDSSKTSHQKSKRRDGPNEDDPNSDEPEDEVMESGIVTLRRSPTLKASPSPDHRSRSKTLVPDSSPPSPDLATPMPDHESPMPGPVPLVYIAQKLEESVGNLQDKDQSLQRHQDQEMELGEVLWKVRLKTKMRISLHHPFTQARLTQIDVLVFCNSHA